MSVFIFPLINHIVLNTLFLSSAGHLNSGKMASGNNALCTKRPYPPSYAGEVMVDSPFNFLACKIQSCIYLPELSLRLAKESHLDPAKPAPLFLSSSSSFTFDV